MKLRVLVTGAAGFVGSRVVRRLLDEGHSVAVILRSGTNTWRIADILARLTIVRADLDDTTSIRRQLVGFTPERVAHLAWQGVGNEHRNDISQFANIRRSFDLLKLTDDLGCRHYIALGSQAEYGPYSQVISEGLPTFPTTAYGAAKLCHFHQAREYCGERGIRFAWLRLFSSYGPGDDPAWMIPYLIQKLLKRERPALTAGEQRWDYIYADDAAAAVACVISMPGAEGLFNLGSGESHPLRLIVEQLRDCIDHALPLGFGEVPYRPDQVMHLEADISRLKHATGWRPQTPIRDGLRATAQWYANRENQVPQ